jgi:diaminopimelate epimerase
MSFETLAGIIQAEVKGREVKVQLTEPKDLSLHLMIPLQSGEREAYFLNTGVPHAVYFVKDPNTVDVEGLGRETRFHPLFQPSGTNANFVSLEDPHHMVIRTYERGVEGETLACGTGAVASALISGALGKTTSPVELTTRGREILKVYFQWNGKRFSNVFLEGNTHLIYSGEIGEEAWR